MVGQPIQIRFASQSNPAEFREQGDERLINAHVETEGSGKSAKQRIRMSPGLTSFSTSATDIACRGKIQSGDYIYAVFETAVVRINSAGTRLNIGYISGTGAVSMALNAAATPQIGVVTASGRYYVIENDTVSQIPTSDIGAFNSIMFIAGYFLLTLADGRCFNTGLNDARSINGLDYFTAEGSPDGLLGGFALRNEAWMIGKETIEVWGLSSSPPATGSPFERLGGSWINKGGKSFHSFAGADNTWFGIGNDGIVYRNNAYTPVRVSTEAVERSIANATSPSTIRGGTYTIHGHAFYVISDASFTWVYDIKERRWHERKSLGLDRWRANVFINAFDKWLVGTTNDGNIYEIDMDARLEGTAAIVTEMHSIDMGDVPERATVSCVEINFVTGRAALSGTVPQTAPFIELSYTDDGGATYSMPRQIALGATGQYDARCRAWKFGRTGAKWGRRWKIVSADPHVLSMSKFTMHVEPLAA